MLGQKFSCTPFPSVIDTFFKSSDSKQEYGFVISVISAMKKSLYKDDIVNESQAKRSALACPTSAVWLGHSVLSQGLSSALFAIEWKPFADVI
jgi:hypothetical protein